MSIDTFHLGIKALIRDEDRKILLFKADPARLVGDNEAHWDLPGGRLERGEDPLTTLRREVKEETGIPDVHITRHLHMGLSNIRIPQREQESVGLILSVYECSIPPGAVVEISDEHTHYQWVEPAEAAKRLGYKFSDEFCGLVSKL